MARIADDFCRYKRSPADPWTLVDILTAVAQQCLAYPNTCEVGGNTGTVNSFGASSIASVCRQPD